ncbi:MAG: T9SS type A sorting domain-containing protein, partial [Bacteroidota bacterium]
GEFQNAMFEVERSAEGQVFTKIDQVQGAGTSQQRLNYQLVDRAPLIGANFYRLRQIDLNGGFSYSDAVRVDYNLAEDIRLSPAYPDPFAERTNLDLELASDQNVSLRLMNALGQEVSREEKGKLAAGRHVLSVSANGLSNGIYYLNVQVGNQAFQQRVMVLKN